MNKLLFAVIAFFLTQHAFGGNVKVYFQDAKFPTQQMVEKQSFGTPAAGGTTQILNQNDGNITAGASVITSFSAQTDVPRNILITPAASTGDVAACSVVVAGTNIYNQSISETFAFLANASTATTGAKAFKTITSVTFPASCEDAPYAAKWSVGFGEKIGLNKCLSSAGDWLQSSVGGTYESTRATIAVGATTVESNTADFNGTMDDSTEFIGYYFQNYRCQP